MKILILGPAYPYRGGIADTNESLARALLKIGHDVKIITFTMQYPSILFPGKTQYSTDEKPQSPTIIRKINSLNPINWISTGNWINSLKPDLVIIRYWLPYMALSLGSIARRIRKNCTVIGLCDNIIPHEKRPGDVFLTRYFVRSCHGFTAMSKTVVKELEEFTSTQILYIPHPINDNLGTKVDKSEAREKLGLDQDGKYLLFFGLVRKYKGLDILLDAMRNEVLHTKNIKLLIAGEFYDSKEEYLSFIKNNQLEKRVIVVDQFVPTKEIKYYFSAVDLVAQTYRSASQSGVSQIAYNFEVPILVTDVGGLSETVLHGKVGYVSKKEPLTIAKHIADFFDQNKYQDFVANIIVEKKKYSWDNFAKQVVDFSKGLE